VNIVARTTLCDGRAAAAAAASLCRKISPALHARSGWDFVLDAISDADVRNRLIEEDPTYVDPRHIGSVTHIVTRVAYVAVRGCLVHTSVLHRAVTLCDGASPNTDVVCEVGRR
jgi:hypothetical protein